MRSITPSCSLCSLFRIAVLQLLFVYLADGSVLPRPNIKQGSTTQISSLDRNYTGERTVVLVTSSELPKQIPPPPTPTKPHRPTPKYDITLTTKESIYKSRLGEKDSFPSARIPYPNNVNSFH